jgi:hypothetical protein
MSWAQFEREVVEKMKAKGLENPDVFAKFFTKKYDECIKSGKDVITNNSISKGNKEFMEILLGNWLFSAIGMPTTKAYDLYFNAFGNAVMAYWAGAILNKTLTPLLPAPGSIQNIGVVENMVISGGTWPQTVIPPMKNPETFIKTFVTLAKIHLTTILGQCTTTSIYPPLATTGPGIIQWVGYKVPDKDPAPGFSTMLFGGKYVRHIPDGSHGAERKVKKPTWKNYLGYDLDGPAGTPIYSPYEGVISGFVDKGPKIIRTNGARVYGTSFTITTMDGRQVFMAHMTNTPKYVRDRFLIQKGQMVGEICIFEDNPTFNHLHIAFSEPTKFSDVFLLDNKGTFR